MSASLGGCMEFFSWFDAQSDLFRVRPWLVLGKGPTFSKKERYDFSGFNIFSLNHVVSTLPVDVAHVIDLDVVYACEHDLEKNAGILLMPWYPHVDFKPGKKTLDELADEIPVLNRLRSLGRLVWYNKSGRKQLSSQPIVRVAYFSAEAPFALLGMAGVKKIKTLGVDGGGTYSPGFMSLGTLLANGQNSFDKQFREIARSVMKYGIDASPLDQESPIRVFVATTEEQMLSVKVLEYSMKQHSISSIEVYPMHRSSIPIPKPRDSKNQARTPFSFQRFLIPELLGYTGRGIYMDSDMQVFSDVREVWDFDMQGCSLLSVLSSAPNDRRPQYSVMLLDGDRLTWNIAEIVSGLDEGRYSYEDLMYSMSIEEAQRPLISADWNSLEKYVKGKTKLLHYTDMNTQPWIYAKHPFGYVWVSALIEAVENGFIDKEYVLDHVEKGWVRPSLAYQVENKIEDALLLPKHILDLDKGYSPPYYKLQAHSANPWVGGLAYVKAKVRSLVYKTIYPVLKRAKHFLVTR
ncbi:glycosyltransferase [Ectopseudomonas khazarica]|uniref:glycosyltransferase n=1 Tax=Ectopseudomonas khazarica TaxID=2502979 RepID=UPI0037C9D3BA